MNKHLLLLLVFSVFFSAFIPSDSSVIQDDKIIIAFGSCSNQALEQVLWDDIVEERPDLWIWLGDNMYGDSEDINVLKHKYRMQKDNPGYQKLLGTTPVIGVWDDHDYGVNNGGKEYPVKAQSQQALLDFFDVPEDDPRRNREGVYSTYSIEKAGVKVKVILLDTRYFRDKTHKLFGLLPNYKGSILGEQQWKWLENELKNSNADVNIIGNGIQVIPNQHKYEKWGNFPNERKRLFNLITSLNVKRPVLISGDRHFAEMSRIKWKGKPIYEVTSSGLTHHTSFNKMPKNKFRVGSVVNVENFAVLEISKSDIIRVKAKVKADHRVLRAKEEFIY